MPAAYLDGVPVFGLPIVTARHQPNLTAAQMNAFFGLTGNQSLFGGGRGRGFLISGVMNGNSPSGCVAAELLLLSYADGLTRTFTDPTGVSWQSVAFYGDYQRTGTPQYVVLADGSWGMSFKCVLIGLV